jgi:uncharacterized protein (TIGR02646 family)
MRRLRRPAAIPPTLRDTGKGGIAAAEHAKKRTLDSKAELSFPGYWNEPDVRGALQAMQGIACAYCQQKLDEERGQVDHFRPKGGGKESGGTNYWWLAYSFDNYFLTCGKCNSPACKWDRFPLTPSGRHFEYADRSSLTNEPRLFIHPVDDPADTWMRIAWKDDEHDDEGFVKPADGLSEGSEERSRVDTTIDVFDLNKNIFLHGDRIRRIRDTRRAWEKGDREEVCRLTCRYLPHGATGYAFLRDADKSALPTLREELEVWLDHLRDKLIRVAEMLRRFPEAKPCETNSRLFNEILWAYAVLWKDPPPDTLTSNELGVWLDKHLGPGIRADIETRLGKLK